MTIDEDLVLLGFGPDDIRSIQDVDTCLMALGYNHDDIHSADCLIKTPNNVMQLNDYKEKLAQFTSQKNELLEKLKTYNTKRAFYEAEAAKIPDFNMREKKMMLAYINPRESQNINNDLKCLHQQINHMCMNVKVIPNDSSFLECRDKLMQKRMELMLVELESKL